MGSYKGEQKRSSFFRSQGLCGDSSAAEIVKVEQGPSGTCRRRSSSVVGKRELRAFSEDSSDSTGDNWFSLSRLHSQRRSLESSGQELQDDKAYSLRPRKQSRTNCLTARTKAEAAVDLAEQKMLHAAQMVLAVQRIAAGGSDASLSQPADVQHQAHSPVCAQDFQEDSHDTVNSHVPISPSGQQAAGSCCIGRKLMIRSQISNQMCLAEVLCWDMPTRQFHLLLDNGADEWIADHQPSWQWMEGKETLRPLHACCAGVPPGLSCSNLVGYSVETFDSSKANFVPALITAYDEYSDTHTLLSDDFGVQRCRLRELTMRIMGHSDSLLQSFPAQPLDTMDLPPLTQPRSSGASDWGSSNSLELGDGRRSFQEHVHASDKQQPSTTSDCCHEHLLPASPLAGEDTLLTSYQFNGALPDACLMPETAHRILQTSNSSADVCWDNMSEQHLGPAGPGYDCSPLLRHTEGLPTHTSSKSQSYGHKLAEVDELDLEKLWAEEP